MHPYYHESAFVTFNTRKVAQTTYRSHYEVSFPSPRPASWMPDHTVFGDFFLPHSNNKVPVVILVHGFGDESVAPCLVLARLLVKHGIAAFVTYLPTHSRRFPDIRHGAMATLPEKWLSVYQSAVAEIRSVVELASNQERVDPDKVCIAGISLGGMISSIAMAVDNRIHTGIFIVIGGNLEELSWGGSSHSIPTGHTCTREDCHNVYRKYPDFLEEIKVKGIENVTPARECFLTDPMTFAHDLLGRSVLMISAENDEIVSRAATTNLWEAYGKPPLVWLPGTHAAAYSQSATISSEIVKFIQ